MVSLMRVSGKETFSARSKAETTSKRVFRQDVERLAVGNASHNTCNNERKDKAHIAIYIWPQPPVPGTISPLHMPGGAQPLTNS